MPIPPLNQSIKERKLSYLHAVLFYMKQYGIYNDQLSTWIQQQILETEQKTIEFKTAKEAKKHFYDEFFKTLLLEFSKAFNLSPDEAHKQLKIIEMLYIWSQERETITSEPIKRSSESKTVSITQNDVPIEHTTLKQKIELLSILSSEPPKWFQGLSKLTQRFLQNELIKVVNQIPRIAALADKQGPNLVDEYLKIFNPIPPSWFQSLPMQQQTELRTSIESIVMHTMSCYLRTVPTLANYGKHIVTIETSEGITVTTQRYRHSIVVPHDVKTPEQPDTEPELIRLTTQNIRQLLGETTGDNQSPLYQVTKRFIEEWNIPPNDPSHPIEIPFLIQTLISPTLYLTQERLSMKILAQVIRNLQQPGALSTYTFTINGYTYYVKPKLTHSNYPLNAGRLLLNTVPAKWSGTKQRNLKNATQLLNNAGIFLSQIPIEILPQGTQTQAFINALYSNTSVTTFEFNQWEELKQEIKSIRTLSPQRKLDLTILIDALHDYSELYRISQERKKPLPDSSRLILASLEEIITERSGGLTTGSCKSGKDRKGMEIIHTDAVLIYYLLYGSFPKWDDTPKTQERQNFAATYAELFNSGQQHKWAATNAPGSYGFEHLQVTPKFLSPISSDLLDAIFKDNPEKLRQSDLLGQLFRPKNPLHEKEMRLTPPSQHIFPKPEISTISNLVFNYEEEPIISSQSIQLPLPKETLNATYFPEGSTTKYETDTVELIGGKIKDHIDAAASCAMEYFTRNPDPDGLIELNGNAKVVETLQWIFVAAFGVDPSYIKIPRQFPPIKVKVKNGLIQVPPKFQKAVNKAKQLIQKQQQLALQTKVTPDKLSIQA